MAYHFVLDIRSQIVQLQAVRELVTSSRFLFSTVVRPASDTGRGLNMAGVRLETIEPDPSSTSLGNDQSVNPETTMQSSNPTADAKSNMQAEMPSADEVDKAIAEVEAKKKEKEMKPEVAVETDGHDTSAVIPPQAHVEKREPSKRVQEAQRYNNRNRDHTNRDSKNRDNKHRDNKPPKNYKENYKSDLTSQEESSDPVAIRKQVK